MTLPVWELVWQESVDGDATPTLVLNPDTFFATLYEAMQVVAADTGVRPERVDWSWLAQATQILGMEVTET